MKKQRLFVLILATLMGFSLVAAGQAVDTKAKPLDAKTQAEIEGKLAAARERLEAAAREIAELSGQLSGAGGGTGFGWKMEKRATIGVVFGRGEEKQREGVTLDSVTPGGPSSNAGLLAGDILTAIDGKPLKGATPSPNMALIKHLGGLQPGAKVKLEYSRAGKKQTVEVTTEAMDFPRRGDWPAHLWQGGPMSKGPAVPGAPGAPPAPRGPGPGNFDRERPAFPGMGTELVTLTPKLGQYFGADKGVLVVRVPEESPFKLEEGDVIVDIEGQVPRGGRQAMRMLWSYHNGETVKINILRNRAPMLLEVVAPKFDVPEFGEMFKRPGKGPDEQGALMPGM